MLGEGGPDRGDTWERSEGGEGMSQQVFEQSIFQIENARDKNLSAEISGGLNHIREGRIILPSPPAAHCPRQQSYFLSVIPVFISGGSFTSLAGSHRSILIDLLPMEPVNLLCWMRI